MSLKRIAQMDCKMTPFVFRAITVLTFATAVFLWTWQAANPRDTVELDKPLPAPRKMCDHLPTADELHQQRIDDAKAEVRAERLKNWGWLLEIVPYAT